MNVTVYAAALLGFSIPYLGFDVFLSYSLLVALAAMAIILALQITAAARSSAALPHGGAAPPAAVERVRWARRQARQDSGIDIIFIGVTWGIFTELATTVQFVGPGLTYPSAAPGPGLVALALGGVVILGTTVAGLWYQYTNARVNRLLARLADAMSTTLSTASEPPMGSPLTSAGQGAATSLPCQARDAMAFAFAGWSPQPSAGSTPHTAPLRSVTFNGPRGFRQERFTVCSAHLEEIVRIQVSATRRAIPIYRS